MGKTLTQVFKEEDDKIRAEEEKNRKIIEEGFEFEKSGELAQRSKDLREKRKKELLAEEEEAKK